MCNRHSFIVTKAGKLFWGLGITDSHTSIRELCGLSANDDTVNAYEWQPPKGWPDADWNIGLVKDNEVFETKSSHESAMEKHIKKLYPSMDAWNTPDHLYQISRDEFLRYGWTELEDGQTVSPQKGDRFFAFGGTITVTGQTGGDCWSNDNSTLNSTGQTGGECWSYGNSTLNKKP